MAGLKTPHRFLGCVALQLVERRTLSNIAFVMVFRRNKDGGVVNKVAPIENSGF